MHCDLPVVLILSRLDHNQGNWIRGCHIARRHIIGLSEIQDELATGNRTVPPNEDTKGVDVLSVEKVDAELSWFRQ